MCIASMVQWLVHLVMRVGAALLGMPAPAAQALFAGAAQQAPPAAQAGNTGWLCEPMQGQSVAEQCVM